LIAIRVEKKRRFNVSISWILPPAVIVHGEMITLSTRTIAKFTAQKEIEWLIYKPIVARVAWAFCDSTLWPKVFYVAWYYVFNP
jgi:hypothetical protein